MHASYGHELTTSYDSLASAGVAYLFDIVAGPARERKDIRHGLVHMVNDSDLLMVSRAGSNAIQVVSQYIMMDSGAQHVIFGKKTCT